MAFPTETVYGLGANGLDPKAVAGIFRVKGRPQDNPLILHVARKETVYRMAAGVPEVAQRLMDAFWPGPLTIILPRGPEVLPEISAGLDSVALRMPAHPVALALIEETGAPVAAPSANLSGRPSPTTAGHVMEDLGDYIDVILDGGTAGIGVESTVLDLTKQVPVILRPGGITPEELAQVLDELQLDPAVLGNPSSELKPSSPGMKYRHYAPKAQLFLLEGEQQKVTEKLQELIALCRTEGRKAGILAYEETAGNYNFAEVVVAGKRREPAEVAARLYSALRRFDELDVDVIFAEALEPKGLGLAVMNRLRRAAGGMIIRVEDI